MFPLLVIAVLAYLILALVGLPIDEQIVAVKLPSGAVMSITTGDAVLAIALLILAIELWRGINARNETLINHAFSAALGIICLMLLQFATSCGTTAFLLIGMIVWIDTLVGVAISTIIAKRNIWVQSR